MFTKNIAFFQTCQKKLNILDIFNLITEHKSYSSKYQKNYNYYIGDHKILYKTIDDKSKPNNKIIVSLPHLTTEVRTGYFSGEPITFSTMSNSKEASLCKELKDILDFNDFDTLNAELDQISAIYGSAIMIIYLDETGRIRIAADTPEHTFVVYDNTLLHEEVAAIRYFEYIDPATKETNYDITVYDADEIRYYNGPESSLLLKKAEPNYFNQVQVIEFIENKYRKGCFENQISIVDAIENVLSSSLNSIEYFDNSYLVLKNLSQTSNEDLKDMKNNRVFLVEGDGDAAFLNKETDDIFTENTLKRLVNDYHKLTQTPDLTDKDFSNSSSGVSLKYKLFSLEKSISTKETLWRKSIYRMIELITNILNKKSSINYDYKQINVTFTRALPSNTSETADLVTKLVGIVSNKTLLSQLDFVEDVEEEIKQIDQEKIAVVEEYDIYNHKE